MGALFAHPTIVATAPARTARLIAFENAMIPSYGLERRGHGKRYPAQLRTILGFMLNKNKKKMR
jgi:hypothetical protein